jgi:hypothetical protein
MFATTALPAPTPMLLKMPGKTTWEYTPVTTVLDTPFTVAPEKFPRYPTSPDPLIVRFELSPVVT